MTAPVPWLPSSPRPSTASGPAELVALLPYQLGFHPRRSLVVVSIRADRTVGLVQRIDLPPPDAVTEAADALVTGLRREPAASALLVGFEDRAGHAEPILRAAGDVCRAEGVQVADRLVVRDGRWWSLDCSDARCCPARGRPVPAPADVPAVADFVACEVSPLPDRADIEQQLRPRRRLLVRSVGAAIDGVLQSRVDAVCADGDPDRLAARRESELRLWAAVLGESNDATVTTRPSELATLAVSLLDRDLRDALLSHLCPGWVDLHGFAPDLAEAVRRHISPLPEPNLPGTRRGRPAPARPPVKPRDPPAGDTVDARSAGLPDDGVDEPAADAAPRPALSLAPVPAPDRLDPVARIARVNRVQDRLVAVCASLPERWTPGPLSLLAWVAWWRGDGALARVALDRALRTDADYGLALVMSRMLDHAVRPHELSGRRDDRPPGGLVTL